ncbi:MAG: DUF401 family protein [Candidatus Caldarchaeum sp.]|uniref:DUF401 family protein n=1 Tax=Caldiarchaeum subterraneum TaxID=311458 RepID=A0A7C5Q5L8_CALS0
MGYLNVLLLTVSVGVVVALVLSKRLNVGYAIIAGAVLYGVTSTAPQMFLQASMGAFNQRMLEVMLSLYFSMTLSYAMRRDGERIYNGMIVFGSKATAVGIPAVIGLLPMPGGAYVSATIADRFYERLKLDTRLRVLINYWWRHIWIPVWPLYQGVILASAILHVSLVSLVSRTWPAAFAAAVAGLVILPKLPRTKDSGLLRDLVSLWPLGLVAILSFTVPLPIAIGLTLLAYLVYSRMGLKELKEVFMKGVNLNVTLIIIGSLIFSSYISSSGLSVDLVNILGPFGPLASFAVPFTIGLSTGIEFAFVALTFAPLMELLDGYSVALAFAGGHIGIMLSPAHSCFVLSSEYFKSGIKDVYPLLIRAIIVELVIITVLIMLLR